MFVGTTPVYVIADMDLCREITVKHFDKFADRMVIVLLMINSALIPTSI